MESTGNLLGALRKPPLLGRTLAPPEDEPNKSNVLVLSVAVWKSAFGQDRNVIGREVALDGRAYSVIGVVSDDSQFGHGVWIPLHMDPGTLSERASHMLNVVGRLKGGVGINSARNEMNLIASRIAGQYPDSQAGRGVMLRSLSDSVSSSARPRLLILLWSVAFVLLLACSNVLGVQLAKAAKYRHEIDLRIALGASRGRVAQYFLIEALILAAAAGLAAFAFSFFGLRLLLVLSFFDVPRIAEVGIGAHSFLVLTVASILCAIIIGIVPALQSVPRAHIAGKPAGLASGSRKTRFRSALVIVQIAITYVLVVASILLLRTLWKLQHVDIGLVPDQVIAMQVSAAKSERVNPATEFFRPVLERIEQLPGVQSAGMITMLPLQNWGMNGNFEIAGRHDEKGSEPFAEIRIVGGDYYRAMGVRLLRGRFFSEDDSANTQQVAIINDVLAARYFPGQDPIGKQITIDKPAIIVGIVKANVQSKLSDRPLPQVDRPYLQFPDLLTSLDVSIVVRSALASQSLLPAIRVAVEQVEPGQSVFRATTMNEVISESLADEKLTFALLGTFGIGALFLSSTGLFGVMAASVTQRTKEIGVRIAVGATRAAVLRMVLGNACKLIVAGTLIGVGASLAAGQVLRGFLFGITFTDVPTYGIVTMLLVLTGLVAAYFPAKRAAGFDPVIALRYQ